MAFDPSLPKNETKLRMAPGVIQDNWIAIEEGLPSFMPHAINLRSRTPLPASTTDDPTTIADTYIAFCKNDAEGNAELFGTNIGKKDGVDTDQITQLTKGVPEVAPIGHTFLPGGLILSWGKGIYTNDAQITSSGIKTIYQVVITIDDSSQTPESRAYVFNIVDNTFQVKLPTGRASLRYMAIGV